MHVLRGANFVFLGNFEFISEDGKKQLQCNTQVFLYICSQSYGVLEVISFFFTFFGCFSHTLVFLLNVMERIFKLYSCGFYSVVCRLSNINKKQVKSGSGERVTIWYYIFCPLFRYTIAHIIYVGVGQWLVKEQGSAFANR